MRLKGEVVDRLRQALGGKAPTEKRIKKLLEEVELARVKGTEELAAMRQAVVIAPSGGSRGLQGPLEALREDLGGGLGIALEDEPDSPQGAPEPVQPVSGPAQTWEEERTVLYATLKQMQAKIEDLTKPVEKDEKGQAIGAGILPSSGVTPPPVGYTGSAQLPQGQWFDSPFGPKIKMKICGCSQCFPHRLLHYFCIVCHSGPHHYQQRYPGGRKMWFAPGSAWGISHESCSPVCWIRYQEYLGVQPGVNDSEPPTGDSAGEPQIPRLPAGSD